MNELATILQRFGVMASRVEKIGIGHINLTYHITGHREYILQRVNRSVFKKPDIIARNLQLAKSFLEKNYPEYLFVAPLPTLEGEQMVLDEENNPWRLFPFIDFSKTLDQLQTPEQAFNAAQEFGRLTRYLHGCAVTDFAPSIERFHDLAWRYEQFFQARQASSAERLNEASSCITLAENFSYLVARYQTLISEGNLTLHIMHNDTKINNILFHTISGKALAAIDLDTLMPGYFIYDLGDMVRTFVSPVSEEETDVSRIHFRKEFYDALLAGYLGQMKDVLHPKEQAAVPWAGLFMTYIMALRFLTDFLNGNVYYQIHYADQNLVRAKNQLHLLQLLSEALSHEL